MKGKQKASEEAGNNSANDGKTALAKKSQRETVLEWLVMNPAGLCRLSSFPKWRLAKLIRLCIDAGKDANNAKDRSTRRICLGLAQDMVQQLKLYQAASSKHKVL